MSALRINALSWRLVRVKPGAIGTGQYWYRADIKKKFRDWEEVARDVFYSEAAAQTWFGQVIDRFSRPEEGEYVVEERQA